MRDLLQWSGKMATASETTSEQIFNWYVERRRQNAPYHKCDCITLCLKAIRSNDDQLLQNLLDLDSVDCDDRVDFQGSRISLVMAAVHYGKADTVRVLCEAGCNLSPQIADQESPLITAIYRNNMDIVKILMKYKADINEPYRDGSTPLFIAVSQGSYDMCNYLIGCGADVNKQNKRGETCLMMACKTANIEVVKLLLEHGADPYPMDKEGCTALHHACNFITGGLYPALVGLIIDALIDHRSVMHMNRTVNLCSDGLGLPIELVLQHWAEKYRSNNFGDTLDLLLLNGASLPPVKIAKSPIEYALKRGYFSMVRTLVKHGYGFKYMEEVEKAYAKADLKTINLSLESWQSARKLLNFLFEQTRPADNEPFVKEIEHALKNPMSLKSLCRTEINQHQRNHGRYWEEHLPKSLNEYMSFDEYR